MLHTVELVPSQDVSEAKLLLVNRFGGKKSIKKMYIKMDRKLMLLVIELKIGFDYQSDNRTKSEKLNVDIHNSST